MDDLVDRYVSELRAALRCERRRKSKILLEIEDHLRQSAAELEKQGLAAPIARHRAIEQLGSADHLARTMSPHAWAWTAAAWYFRFGAAAGVAVLAYGLYWLILVVVSWIAFDDGALALSTQPLRPMPSELTAALTTVLVGCSITGIHVVGSRLLMEASDLRNPDRVLSTAGSATLGAAALTCLVLASYDLAGSGFAGLELRNSEWLPRGVPLLAMALLLRRLTPAEGEELF